MILRTINDCRALIKIFHKFWSRRLMCATRGGDRKPLLTPIYDSTLSEICLSLTCVLINEYRLINKNPFHLKISNKIKLHVKSSLILVICYGS